MLSPWLKYVWREEVGRSILDYILFNIILNLANFIGVLMYVWYVVVVTTTTCRQLGNDITYDTEKKNPTSHDVADTSAVSGRRVGKTQRHVVKTNRGRHLKRRLFQLSPLQSMPRCNPTSNVLPVTSFTQYFMPKQHGMQTSARRFTTCGLTRA